MNINIVVFFLAKRIFGYCDEERVQYSSHKGIFEYRDEENPHTIRDRLVSIRERLMSTLAARQ
jgi:hypothetical protein